jgi:DNA helicase II / ATP-dependent DNA helicase PcrA
MIERLRDVGTPRTGQIELVREWYQLQLERLYDYAAARTGDLDQLEQIAAGYVTRERFLTELTLDPPDASGAEAGRPQLDEDHLILSTIHSAKGQEWDAVFVLNLVDGCIPSDMASGRPEQIDEERRLLYVAMTRAREHLHLLQPLRFYFTHQHRHGRGHVMTPRSRFLPDEVLGLFTAAPPRRTVPPMRCHCDRQRRSTSAPACATCGADPPGSIVTSAGNGHQRCLWYRCRKPRRSRKARCGNTFTRSIPAKPAA